MRIERLIVAAALLAAFAFVGCKGKSGGVTLDIPEGTGPDGGDAAGRGDVSPSETLDEQGEDLDVKHDWHFTKDDHGQDDVDLIFPDVPDKDEEEVGPDVWAPEPCKSHDDCNGEGMCIELSPGSGKFVCAPFCVEECPSDWECKSVYVDGPDPSSLCFPPTETTCLACQQDKECLFAGALCIKGGGAVGYCGKLCDPDKPDCPDDFICEMAKDKDGKDLAPQCMPKDGFCCVASKLKDCDDKNPCTADYCDPSFGCKHKPQDGECTGNEPCTLYKCINGACMGVPVTIDYTLDGIDDDCDGITDEDWILDMHVPFGVFSSGIGETAGGGIKVNGAISTPPAAGASSGGDFVVTPVTTKVVVPEE